MDKKILYEGKYLRFWNRGSWEYVERKNCDGIVVVIALTDDKKVVFVEQYRVPLEANVIEFTAGLVNDSGLRETLIDAAKRELFEETGYRTEKMEFLTEGPVSSGLCSEKISFFYASQIEKKGPGGGDSTESIKVHEIPLGEVDDWLEKIKEKGILVDPKVFAGLYFLNKN